MSELFREAFRTHSAQQARTTLDELGEYAAGRNPKGYTEADVPGSFKKCAPRGPAAGYGLTDDRRHRHKRLDFRASICERSRHADTALEKAMSEDVIATGGEIEAEIVRVLTEKFSWEQRRATSWEDSRFTAMENARPIGSRIFSARKGRKGANERLVRQRSGAAFGKRAADVGRRAGGGYWAWRVWM